VNVTVQLPVDWPVLHSIIECLLTSPLLSPSPSKERGKRFIERGFTPLLPTHPLPLLREGVRGMGC